MVKNNHVYALNYDIKSVQQNQSSKSLVVKATTDYYINEKEAPPKYRMIKDIDDISKLKLDKDEKEVSLVPELNNLHDLFFKVIATGYKPKITFQAGAITEMRLRLHKVKYIIKTQNLVKSSPDGCIKVRDEMTYHKMNEAMFKFNKSLFHPIHKSRYNDIDIAILDDARTIAPLGLIWDKKNIPKDIIELDICKAFTKAFMDILLIPQKKPPNVLKKHRCNDGASGHVKRGLCQSWVGHVQFPPWSGLSRQFRWRATLANHAVSDFRQLFTC